MVTGEGKDSSDATVVLHERTASGWQAGREWPAHNALKGWTSHHTAGDLHSPIGVFSLTDAGGLLPDPGTRLPYDHSGGFAIVGTGFEASPSPARSTTWSRSTTTASRAPRRVTGPGPSERAAAEASGST